MSAYTDALPVVDIGGGDYLTAAELRWNLGKQGSGLTYTVEAGFQFDVSVPFFLRWAFDPHRSDYLKAAALHDHMLIAGWSRATAAAEFYNALRADGVSRWRRSLMVAGVIVWTVR